MLINLLIISLAIIAFVLFIRFQKGLKLAQQAKVEWRIEKELNTYGYKLLALMDAALDENLPFPASKLRLVFDAGSVGCRDYYYRVEYEGAAGLKQRSYVHISTLFYRIREVKWSPQVK